MSLKGTKTANNLLTAFAGEAQANLRYTYYAKQAKKEGYIQIKMIFEETARNEIEHAERFFGFLTDDDAIDGSKLNVDWDYPVKYADTKANLLAAAEGEHEEFVSMYPDFADIAEEEGFKEIARVFREIAEVEERHEIRYRKLHKNMEEDRVFHRDEVVLWKCNNCGYIHEGKSAPERCPACDHPQGYFELFVEPY